ncbi:MAG: DUF934 domain-containing protein [Burkholderiaceae bacterium]|jgi:uncharacterized protein (DUF934 family)|nr:DUF934 domain-containing protein [Burkholderiaceae bacterium]
MKLIAHNHPDAQAPGGAQVLQLANNADLQALADAGAFDGIARIELVFPKFTDGRAFSQALWLRRRHGFAGDVRATGDVLVDQLVQMARCGFSSAVLAAGVNPDAATAQFARYSGGYYQGDVLHPQPRFAASAVAPSVHPTVEIA